MDDDNVMSLDLETVRRRSPLKGDAITRVLDAAGLPLAMEAPTNDGGWRKIVPSGAELEAVRLTLAAVADLCASYRMQLEALPTAKRDRVEAAFLELMVSLADACGAAGGPPPPPQAWAKEMLAWSSGGGERRFIRKGRPTDVIEPKIYRLLLSFYEACYGVSPGSGHGGPTSRFLLAFFREMHLQFSASTLVNPSPHAPDLAGLFPPPSLDTIRNKIRQHKDPDDRADEFRLVIGYCELIHQKLGPTVTLQ